MSEILKVGYLPQRDKTIIRKQYHSYSPYTSAYDNNDEVRIVIQSQDLYLLPSESYISVDVEVKKKATVAAQAAWVSGYAPFFFSEMRYELNNVEIDRIKNPGLTSNIKHHVALPESDDRLKQLYSHFDGKQLEDRVYSLIIPLKFVFGFCEDYRKIIMNAKHELILVRSRKDILAYESTSESFDFKVKKIQWKIPHVQLSDESKLTMLRYLERARSITVPYRSWDLYEMPQLPTTDKHIWTVKSTTQLTKPRYVFVVFQTNRQRVNVNSAAVDNCNISDVKLYLNTEYYPYENTNSNFDTWNIQDLYYALTKIQQSYYSNLGGNNPIKYDLAVFKTSPIFAFDCSRTDDSLIGGPVDVRIEINARAQIAANTAAYCIIVHENQFEYSPFSSIVVKSA